MKGFKVLFTMFLLPLLMTNGAFANHSKDPKSHEIVEVSNKQKSPEIRPNKNEIILVVHGVVCSFCSYGIQKKLSKLDFVDISKFNKKGSKVDIENQRVTIAVKQGSNANIEVIFKEIESGGYKPVKAYSLDDQGKIKIYAAK